MWQMFSSHLKKWYIFRGTNLSARKSVWLIVSFVTITSLHHCCAAMENVAVMELIRGSNSSPAFIEASAIFDQAVSDLREKYAAVMNITRIRLHDEDFFCYSDGERLALLAARQYYREISRNASVGLFYPACFLYGALGDLTREWNVPLFIPTGADWDVSTKIKRFPNQIRLASRDWMDFLYNVLQQFGYATAGILCVDDYWDMTTRNWLTRWDTLSRHNFTVRRFDVSRWDSNKTLDRALDDIKSATRVVVISAPDERIRQIMLAAYDKGMTDGSYVYLTFDNYNRNIPTFLSTNYSDERSKDARAAFRSLFTISYNVQNTSEYHNFTKKVKRLSREKYGKTYAAEEEISLRLQSAYFAVSIYGQVLNESIANSWDTRDGAALARLMQNRTFTILGNEILINSNGDRESNWVLNQMDPATGIYRPVLTDSDGGKSIQPFRDPLDKGIHPIVWFNRTGPPPNEPKCGYLGTKPACDTWGNVTDHLLHT